MKIYKNRFEPIKEYCSGDVLDIGCVGMGTNDVLGGEDFIGEYLKLNSKSYTGIDINGKGIDLMKKSGYNAIWQDAQKQYNLKKKFDVIFSEENIEHISNLGIYLENVYNHLKPDGKFILTTPNANAFEFFLQTLIFGKPRVSKFHTHIHTTDTIKYLLRENYLTVEKIEIIQPLNFKTTNLFGKLYGLFCWCLPKRFGRTIIIIAKKDAEWEKDLF
jgi:2-polyprenyl-3-methyl-5-hydroxy-6-metoxy-1,4-benzoquinol methylase